MNVKSIKSKLTAAFSLIELMVVIAIVALLTAIAVPSYQGYLQQSKVTEIFSLASDQMNQWEQQYNLGGTSFPITNAPTGGIGNYISQAVLTSAGATGGASSTGVSNCAVNTLANPLGTVCIVLNSNAGTIDPSLSGLVIEYYANTQGTATGDTTDTSISWSCYFATASVGSGGTVATATSLLSPGNCTAN